MVAYRGFATKPIISILHISVIRVGHLIQSPVRIVVIENFFFVIGAFVVRIKDNPPGQCSIAVISEPLIIARWIDGFDRFAVFVICDFGYIIGVGPAGYFTVGTRLLNCQRARVQLILPWVFFVNFYGKLGVAGNVVIFR